MPAKEGFGYDQGTARRKAKGWAGGAIAVSARNPDRAQRWRLGGWPRPDDVWIVISLDGKLVLDDGGSESPWPLAVTPPKSGK